MQKKTPRQYIFYIFVGVLFLLPILLRYNIFRIYPISMIACSILVIISIVREKRDLYAFGAVTLWCIKYIYWGINSVMRVVDIEATYQFIPSYSVVEAICAFLCFAVSILLTANCCLNKFSKYNFQNLWVLPGILTFLIKSIPLISILFSFPSDAPILFALDGGISDTLCAFVLFYWLTREKAQKKKLNTMNSITTRNTDVILDTLQKLGELKETGAISQEEFEQKKKELLERF